jgi:hypothetical protein
MGPYTLGKASWVAAAVVSLSALGSRAQAQDDAPATQPSLSDLEWRRQVEARVHQLEQENQELRRSVGEIRDTQQAVIKDAESRGLLSLEGGEPRLTTPDFFDVNKYVSEGEFPGSFLLPGTKTSFQIGGYVQLDAIFDADRIDNKEGFVVNAIPTGGNKTGAGDTNFTIRQTRLFLKTETPVENWDKLVTYVEIDFQGTDGAEPRIRHAYGQIGDTFQILGGQTFSAFQDATVFPSTLDAQGPPGIINSRRPQLRFRREFDERWIGVVSIEDPQSELSVPPGFAGEQSTPYPDLDGNIRWQPDWGHLQLSGVARYLQFDPDEGSRRSDIGFGLSLTGSVKTFKLDDKHVDSVLFQVAGGNGIARYINDTSGLGLDAGIKSPGESLDGLNTYAAMLVYQHWWTQRWGSTLGYSIVSVDNVAGQGPDTYHRGQYGFANLRYYPTDRVMLGGEILYGVRENRGGSTGDDLRLQFSAQYRF